MPESIECVATEAATIMMQLTSSNISDVTRKAVASQGNMMYY